MVNVDSIEIPRQVAAAAKNCKVLRTNSKPFSDFCLIYFFWLVTCFGKDLKVFVSISGVCLHFGELNFVFHCVCVCL